MLTGMLHGNALAVVKWIDGPADRWRTKFLIIEGDRLQTPPELLGDPQVRGGRRLDRNGRVVGYYIRRVHPGDRTWWLAGAYAASSDDFDYVPAFSPWGRRLVIHLADRTRPAQSLGTSIFTPTMRELRQVGSYTNAELSRAVVQSLVAAFIESGLDANALAQLFHGASGGKGIAGAEAHWRKTLGEYRPQLKGGAIIPLPIGARAKGFENGAPSGQFSQFVDSLATWLGAGLNIPRELLLKDFTKSNYSSARAALLEATRFFLGRRGLIIRKWLNPVQDLWAEEAVHGGRIEVDLNDWYRRTSLYQRGRWVFAGRGWVDPTKEAQAAQLRMQIGVSTLESECAEQGLDWEEVAEQRAYERRRLVDELGLPDPYAPTKNASETRSQRDSGAPEDDPDDPDRTEERESAAQPSEEWAA
jgi:lambda family phage portal protein